MTGGVPGSVMELHTSHFSLLDRVSQVGIFWSSSVMPFAPGSTLYCKFTNTSWRTQTGQSCYNTEMRNMLTLVNIGVEL